ncbi:RNA-directed DNA polymerase, eukaryota, reverse transcriptase zinc-binding domain protein [Tanacetum coccineum]
MINLSQKRKNSSDIDDLDAIRVPMEDKVGIIGEIGEIGECGKEKDMEEGECVKELIHEVNDVASSNLKSGDEKHNGIEEELNKGVDNHKTASNEARNSNPNMKSYANKLSDGLNSNDNELFFVPTVMKENDEKVVIFDEELVKEGSEKWKYTVCGYFVGYRIEINELRLGYARVLIEINVEDEFSDNIEINYVDVINCVMKPKPKTTVHNQARPNAEKNIGHQGNKQQPIGVKVAYKPKEAADKSKEGTQERTKHQETRAEVNKSPKVWNVGKIRVWVKLLVLQGEIMQVVSRSMDFKIASWNIRGMCKESKQKELKKFIADEKLHVCTVLETHLKTKSISKACDYVFGRMSLWKELLMHKHNVNQKAWVLMGDFNVTLKPEEHSNGSSKMSIDMNKFRDAVNNMEVDDLCSTGFQFTWTKSLKNVSCNTLKKLDRIMINEDFLLQFRKAHADKDDFLDIVRDGWNHNVRGCHMYRVVQKLKLLKKPLNKLNWQNGNLFDKVNDLKEKLKDAQSKVDVDPFNLEKRKNTVSLMNEYSQAAEDDLKLLHQKDKIRWLEEVKEFFKNGKILGEINATLIALVSKMDTLTSKNSLERLKSTDNDMSWLERINANRRENRALLFLFKVRDIYDARMSNLDCLANALSDGRWKWADEWSNRNPMLIQIVLGAMTLMIIFSLTAISPKWCGGKSRSRANWGLDLATCFTWLGTYQQTLKKRTEDNLYDVIVGNITDMLKCLRVRKSTEVLNVAKQWNLKWEKEKLIAEI